MPPSNHSLFFLANRDKIETPCRGSATKQRSGYRSRFVPSSSAFLFVQRHNPSLVMLIKIQQEFLTQFQITATFGVDVSSVKREGREDILIFL